MNKELELKTYIESLGQKSKAAALVIGAATGTQRQSVLSELPRQLTQVKEELAKANQEDLRQAKEQGLREPLLKRLEISPKVFAYMLARLEEVAALPDPLGKVREGHTRPNGLRVEKISVPLGVIGIIYESRPNVTTDAAAVCLKSGNAVILRGGSECLNTNRVLVEAMRKAFTACGLPADGVQAVDRPGHEAVRELFKLDKYIDVLIPRGGKGLIKEVAENTRIPVIKHYDGICHLYLAADAPPEMAVAVTVNSKCERVEVCNALETLLVDVQSANRLLPVLAKAFAAQGVTLRGCEATRRILPDIEAATEEDWSTEYLAPILSIRVVNGIEEAIKHINTYGSKHTDGIITQNLVLAARFTREVDAASVLVNASTRLSGGGDYGLGAVVGISTDKIHARGPVGPDELTSYKWVVYGDGHIRK